MNQGSETMSALPIGTTAADHAGAELKRGAFFNTLTLVASNFRSIFTFLVARVLGPAALGTFSVAWANIDLLSKIGIFGLDDAITTFIARAEAAGDHTQARRFFRLAVGLGLMQSIATLGVLYFALDYLRDQLQLQPEVLSSLSVVLCALPGVTLFRISTGVSRGFKIMRHETYSRGLTDSLVTTLVFVLALVLGFRKFTPEISAIIGATASGVVALWLSSTLFAEVPPTRPRRSLARDAWSLLSFAAPISAYQFLNAFILRIDMIMLGWFVGRAPGVTLTTVGIYGVALGIANGLRKINHAFNPIFAPVMAGLTGSGDRPRAIATYARLAQWMLWLLLPTLAVIALAGNTILLLYGPAFRAGSTWLGITAVACAIEAYVGFGETIIMVQRPHLNLLNSAITCVIAVMANLWLIPRFGVTGAAFGILVPFLAQGILRYIALRFIFRWHNPVSNIAPPFIAAALAILPALLCRTQLHGIPGQIASAALFLVVFVGAWRYHRARSMNG
jgi:O-antigen/teichoic acid export membrane protein